MYSSYYHSVVVFAQIILFYTIYFSIKTEVVYVPRVEFMYQMPKLVNKCNLHSLISIGLCYHPFLS